MTQSSGYSRRENADPCSATLPEILNRTALSCMMDGAQTLHETEPEFEASSSDESIGKPHQLIAKLGDWRGKTLAGIRKTILAAAANHRGMEMDGKPGVVARRHHRGR